MWITRRVQSKQNRASWLADYAGRLHRFVRDAGADPSPAVLPALDDKEASELAVVIASARAAVANEGHQPVLSAEDRRRLANRILAMLKLPLM